MKIRYDRRIKIAGVGIVPWPRLGPERWFEDYKIISLYGWDIDIAEAPQVLLLNSREKTPARRLNTQALLNNPSFQDIVLNNLPGYNILLYKPLGVDIPLNLRHSSTSFLGTVSKRSESLENKIIFRSKFKDQLPFSRFKILDPFSEKEALSILKEEGAVVLQHESLSGGKGTFVIRGLDDYHHALDAISRIHGSRRFVVSKYVEDAAERSLQCCVTRYGVFVGPLQKQIVRNESLLNVLNTKADKFCGAEISFNDQFLGCYKEMAGYCETIGSFLLESGYRGIFGVDFLIDRKRGQPLVLEVNQRLTGVTPLLDMLYQPGDLPFYLLHILETGNFDYEILDHSVNPSFSTGSLLVIHSKATSVFNLKNSPTSGLYRGNGKHFLLPAYRFDENDKTDNILLQRYLPIGSKIKPGARLATIFSKQSVLGENDELKKSTLEMINNIYSNIKFEK